MRPILLFLTLFSMLHPGLAEEIELVAAPGESSSHIIKGIDPNAECFEVEVRIDPVVADAGDLQVVASLAIGSIDGNTEEFLTTLREGGARAAYDFRFRGESLTRKVPSTKPPGWMDNRDYQQPDHMMIREGDGYSLRMVVWPENQGSRVRVFVNAMDRPKEDHFLANRIKAGSIQLQTIRGGRIGEPSRISRFSEFKFTALTQKEARTLPPNWETVLRAIDFSYPPMKPIGEAIARGRMKDAKEAFLNHMKSRSQPKGPQLDNVPAAVLHPNYRRISDAALEGKYGTLGYFDKFVAAWTDTKGGTHKWVTKEEPLQLNWAKDLGYLNRHFHWVSLAKTWEETGQPAYAKRFSDEVLDWVSREPFYWERAPTIGGLNIMDGTTFRLGYMNTSNIGRRLEMTWWPAYEVFRKAREFSDESHFALLVGMIRQAELITNPSSFAVHDDGAAHTTMALLQTALLLPEFKASKRWEKLALKRWDEMVSKQFHPDGSHVSLSLGYNWATILTMENFIRLHEQLGLTPPPQSLELLEKAMVHPILLSTPNQSMIPLNDAGWGVVDDKYQNVIHWIPAREDFKWMASQGSEGAPPKETSLYFPNAGQYVMRTGWGDDHKYLFFGAGPWGASHGKQDALNIFTQFGRHPLIRDAGRGSYSGVGHTVHAGRSLSYNTLSPDWAQENSIPHWRHDMHLGFHPPKRRWISNAGFDYGEGAFTYGWYKPDEHILGKWLRQVIFVKGQDTKKDGYYIVIDTVEPADSKQRTWRHPWQLNPDAISIRSVDKSIVAKNDLAALQILPVDSSENLGIEIIKGQVKPELLGWRIHGTIAKEWPVPTYHWKADGAFSKAWIIQMQQDESQWPVKRVESLPAESPAELRFKVIRNDGSSDHVIRRFPDAASTTFNGHTIQGDLAVFSQSADGRIPAKLELSGGLNSVARPEKEIVPRGN